MKYIAQSVQWQYSHLKKKKKKDWIWLCDFPRIKNKHLFASPNLRFPLEQLPFLLVKPRFKIRKNKKLGWYIENKNYVEIFFPLFNSSHLEWFFTSLFSTGFKGFCFKSQDMQCYHCTQITRRPQTVTFSWCFGVQAAHPLPPEENTHIQNNTTHSWKT